MTTQEPIFAVVDSNVYVAMYTLHDLLESQRNSESQKRQNWRGDQVTAALRLAIYLHEQNATTLSVLPEPVEKTAALVPPEKPSSKTRYLQLFTQFVRPYVLPNWRDVGHLNPTVQGTPADREFERLAALHGCPLITFEGDTPDGIKDQGMRKRAKKAGIDVCTPVEFCNGKLDQAAIDRFFERFVEHAPTFIRLVEQSPDHRRGAVLGYTEVMLRGLFDSMRLMLGVAVASSV